MELVKRNDRYDLFNVDGHKIASTLNGCANKLSLKNCEEIANGYDLDELSSYWRWYYSDIVPEHLRDHLKNSYKAGFQAALEILGDKKFSERDMIEFADKIYKSRIENKVFEELPKIIQSLQQTEWKVEIEMEPEYIRMGGVKGVKGSSTKLSNPAYGCKKTDENGCLILKRI